MQVTRSICRVEEKSGKKRWVVVRNDYDPDSVGEVTACGLPCRAIDVPVGTTFETVFTIPDFKPTVTKAMCEVRIRQDARGQFQCWEVDGCGPSHALFLSAWTMAEAVAGVKKRYPKFKQVSATPTVAIFRP